MRGVELGYAEGEALFVGSRIILSKEQALSV